MPSIDYLATATAPASLLNPDSVHDLVVQPTMQFSVAALVSTLITTDGPHLRVPIVTADPSAAWVAEGAEIPVTNADVEELLLTPAKLAGLSVISSELADDSSPAAAQLIGDGLARDLARKLDAAYFGSKGASTVQPPGLGDLLGFTPVSAGANFTSVDPFAEAVIAAENVGAQLTSFVANPADVLKLAKLRQATGSNVPLLGADPTAPGKRMILGLPLIPSPAVTAGTIWGLPKDRAIVVIRDNADVEADSSPFFSSDRVAIRAKLRVSFGWPHPAAIAKITTT